VPAGNDTPLSELPRWTDVQNAVMGGIGGTYDGVNQNYNSDPQAFENAAAVFDSALQEALQLQADLRSIAKALRDKNVWKGQAADQFGQLADQTDETLQKVIGDLGKVPPLIRYARDALTNAVADLIALNQWSAQATEWWWENVDLRMTKKPQLPNGVWTPSRYPVVDHMVTEQAHHIGAMLDDAYRYVSREMPQLASAAMTMPASVPTAVPQVNLPGITGAGLDPSAIPGAGGGSLPGGGSAPDLSGLGGAPGAGGGAGGGSAPDFSGLGGAAGAGSGSGSASVSDVGGAGADSAAGRAAAAAFTPNLPPVGSIPVPGAGGAAGGSGTGRLSGLPSPRTANSPGTSLNLPQPASFSAIGGKGRPGSSATAGAGGKGGSVPAAPPPDLPVLRSGAVPGLGQKYADLATQASTAAASGGRGGTGFPGQLPTSAGSLAAERLIPPAMPRSPGAGLVGHPDAAGEGARVGGRLPSVPHSGVGAVAAGGSGPGAPLGGGDAATTPFARGAGSGSTGSLASGGGAAFNTGGGAAPGGAGAGGALAESAPGAGAAGRGMGGMPMMPMSGGGGAPGGKSEERERTTWLTEDREVWSGGPQVGPGVLRSGSVGESSEPDLLEPVEREPYEPAHPAAAGGESGESHVAHNPTASA